MPSKSDWENNSAIQKFREYLRIPSVHPDIDYESCLVFLKRQAEELGLPHHVTVVLPKKPVLVMTWEGVDPSLTSVLLNSHMDVVPVYEESWTHPPFSAHLTEDGKIYARGSQDMKCVGIQYLEAVRRLKQKGVRLQRTVHLSFMPEEETGGQLGMQKYVLTDDFKALRVGLALDEGVPSTTEDYLVFNGERSIWHLKIKCPGKSGHGSLLLPNTAGEKVRVIMDRFMDFREQEKQKLADNPSLIISDVTTINLTGLSGGVQTNVVPEALNLVFDIRLAVDVDHDAFESMVRGWCKEAGDGVAIEFEHKDPKIEITRFDDTNPFWGAFKGATDKLGLKVKPLIFPGGTDSRYLRELSIPAIGFSPINLCPQLLHQNNEYLHADSFLRGIDIYEEIIPAVANVS